MHKRGMILMVGATGSGKSTTLAAMVNHRNENASDHILTIEDPIEFVHESRRCLINQREVHRDTLGFAEALRSALREDPDIILVGEMRDLETILETVSDWGTKTKDIDVLTEYVRNALRRTIDRQRTTRAPKGKRPASMRLANGTIGKDVRSTRSCSAAVPGCNAIT